jgi:hypothetical protein
LKETADAIFFPSMALPLESGPPTLSGVEGSSRIANGGTLVEQREILDAIDQRILRTLALYESMEAVELWYEIGEDDSSRENLTEEEVLSRLRFLTEEGFVKRVKGPRGRLKWAVHQR